MTYKSRTGPPNGAYILTGTFTPVPGFTIKSTFGNGPILFIWQCNMVQNVANNGKAQFGPLIDGVLIPDNAQWQVPISAADDRTHVRYLPPLPGVHTYSMSVRDAAATGGVTMNQNASRLTVIELPEWDETPYNQGE